MCVPDCSGAEGGRGAGGDVGVVLGVQLIINRILQENKNRNSSLSAILSDLNAGFTLVSHLLTTMCGAVTVRWTISIAQIRG